MKVTTLVSSETSKLIQTPVGIALDPQENLYVVDLANSTVCKLSRDGNYERFAGELKVAGKTDGIGKNARFSQPYAITSHPAGHFLVADTSNSLVREVMLDGSVRTLGDDGVVNSPWGVSVSLQGEIAVACTYQHTVVVLSGSGEHVRTHKESGVKMNYPTGLAHGRTGEIYVSDTGYNRILKIGLTGEITVIAGRSNESGHKDGVGEEAMFNLPEQIALDSEGNIYVCELENHCVRRIDQRGNVTTFAGEIRKPGHCDGRRSSVLFDRPFGIALTSRAMYVSELPGRIRKITFDPWNKGSPCD